jgi:hypothetical protein
MMFQSVLAVSRDDEDMGVILGYACALAEEHRARLTMMHLLSPTPLAYLAASTGACPEVLLADHEHDEARRLRRAAAQLPNAVTVRLICRRGWFAESLVSEVMVGHHDCVVAEQRTLDRRIRARLRRRHPELRVVVVGADGGRPRGEPIRLTARSNPVKGRTTPQP